MSEIFSLGIVGKLKIQVPWTKLGREPILIVLQDVYICACPRDEFEVWMIIAYESICIYIFNFLLSSLVEK